MKELKDYLHLYANCDLLFGEVVYKLWYIKDYQVYMTRTSDNGFSKWNACDITTTSLKPLLRPLSSISKEEFMELAKYIPFVHEQTRYLLSKGFDLFGLIEAGLATEGKSER